MIEVDRVTMIFSTSHGPLTALQDVSFRLAEGEFISFIGPSGCGKSTLLRLIADIYQPTRGTVQVDGRTPEQARKANLISLMFQEPVLLPWLTAYQNVELALRLTRPNDPLDPMWLLDFVGLKGREKDYPHQLSGGQQQRVALARALVTNPKLLLMDEPFAALDELTRDRMGQWLLSIWDQTKKTVAFVTHSIPEALYLSDRVVVMDAHPGRIRAEVEVALPRPRHEAIKGSLVFFELLQILRDHLRAETRAGEVSDA
ncbi:MAG: ABC transporter ATP-binding protein [Candidatus Tectomicrobia bacterium]|nr:ABC transporter ATP-binding protein [Candidatus Tectomicrobia bacterium]